MSEDDLPPCPFCSGKLYMEYGPMVWCEKSCPSACSCPDQFTLFIENAALREEVERLRAERDEARRRRDEWRAKAEEIEVLRKALREKVGAPWPPSLSRALWAGIAADEKRRADDAEAEAAALREEVERLRAALELTADTDPDEGTAWFHDVAAAALAERAEGQEGEG